MDHEYNNPNLNPEEFLLAIVRDVRVPLEQRIIAATALIQHKEQQEAIKCLEERGLLLTIEGVMKETGQSQKTVYNYINRGIYRTVKYGFKTLVDKTSVLDWRKASSGFVYSAKSHPTSSG
jgi:predicted transcriptional regulator YheO